MEKETKSRKDIYIYTRCTEGWCQVFYGFLLDCQIRWVHHVSPKTWHTSGVSQPVHIHTCLKHLISRIHWRYWVTVIVTISLIRMSKAYLSGTLFSAVLRSLITGRVVTSPGWMELAALHQRLAVGPMQICQICRLQKIRWMEEILHEVVIVGNYETL